MERLELLLAFSYEQPIRQHIQRFPLGGRARHMWFIGLFLNTSLHPYPNLPPSPLLRDF